MKALAISLFGLFLSFSALAEEPVCGIHSPDPSSFSCAVGSLRVSHLGQPVVFQDFQNATATLPNGKEIQVAAGSVTQINRANAPVGAATEFSVLPNALSRESVDSLLQLLESYPYLDEDPDTVVSST